MKGTGKVIPVPKHHAVKAYREYGTWSSKHC